jgi:hypothetical protein
VATGYSRNYSRSLDPQFWKTIGFFHGGSLLSKGICSPILNELGLRTAAQPPTECRTLSKGKSKQTGPAVLAAWKCPTKRANRPVLRGSTNDVEGRVWERLFLLHVTAGCKISKPVKGDEIVVTSSYAAEDFETNASAPICLATAGTSCTLKNTILVDGQSAVFPQQLQSRSSQALSGRGLPRQVKALELWQSPRHRLQPLHIPANRVSPRLGLVGPYAELHCHPRSGDAAAHPPSRSNSTKGQTHRNTANQ